MGGLSKNCGPPLGPNNVASAKRSLGRRNSHTHLSRHLFFALFNRYKSGRRPAVGLSLFHNFVVGQ